jgi:hypothetical protein
MEALSYKDKNNTYYTKSVLKRSIFEKGSFLSFPTYDGREMYTNMYTVILKLVL